MQNLQWRELSTEHSADSHWTTDMMNSTGEMSFSPSAPSNDRKHKEQSKGVSVTGTCSASALARARADLSSDPDGASWLILQFVDRRMINMGGRMS